MSPLRLLLPLLLVSAGGGYALGRFVHARLADRPAPSPRGADTTAAHEALARIRAESDADRRAAMRRAFLARFSQSWLRARWEAGR